MNLLSTKLPDVVPNLIHIHRKMKALSFALLDPTIMESAVTYAFQKVENLPKLESDDGNIKMVRNYTSTANYSYSPGWEENTPAPMNETPQHPPSPELKYVDIHSPMIVPHIHRTPSPIDPLLITYTPKLKDDSLPPMSPLSPLPSTYARSEHASLHATS
jgi:hypothetical protein